MGVSALPVSGHDPNPDDPAEILRVLPSRYHEQFRAEYAAAVERARAPEGYRDLTDLLRLWRLRARAYSDPGYPDRLAAARAGGTSEDIPARELIPGWPKE